MSFDFRRSLCQTRDRPHSGTSLPELKMICMMYHVTIRSRCKAVFVPAWFVFISVANCANINFENLDARVRLITRSYQDPAGTESTPAETNRFFFGRRTSRAAAYVFEI